MFINHINIDIMNIVDLSQSHSNSILRKIESELKNTKCNDMFFQLHLRNERGHKINANLSAINFMKQIILNLDAENNGIHKCCLTLIGEYHNIDIENKPIENKIQLWSLITLLLTMYINVQLLLELPSYFKLDDYKKQFDDIIYGVIKNPEYTATTNKMQNESGEKNSKTVDIGGEIVKIIKKSTDKYEIIPLLFNSDNMLYTLYKLVNRLDNYNNIKLIDARKQFLFKYFDLFRLDIFSFIEENELFQNINSEDDLDYIKHIKPYIYLPNLKDIESLKNIKQFINFVREIIIKHMYLNLLIEFKDVINYYKKDAIDNNHLIFKNIFLMLLDIIDIYIDVLNFMYDSIEEINDNLDIDLWYINIIPDDILCYYDDDFKLILFDTIQVKFWNVMPNIPARIMDFYTLIQFYSSVIYGKPNYYILFTGSAHVQFIDFCFRRINCKNIEFNHFNSYEINTDDGKYYYTDISNLYYPNINVSK